MNTYNNVFRAYLRGGSKWPQIRGGINIYMLGSLVDAYTIINFDWNSFIKSDLSPEAIVKSQTLMDSFHKKSGISLTQYPNLQDEWNSAKAGIIKSALYFIQGQAPVYEKSIKELLNKTNADTIGVCFLDVDLANNFTKLCMSAETELIKLEALSNAFIYFISKNKFNLSEINNFAVQYGFRIQSDDIANAKTILSLVENNLTNTLNKSFTNSYTKSICWGFELPYLNNKIT